MGGGGTKSDKDQKPCGISESEVRDVEEMSTPRTPVIYEVIRLLGDEEMQRPATSPGGRAWRRVSMSFSLLAQSALEARLPDANWKPLVASLGYTVGFLMVVLGRIVRRKQDHGRAAVLKDFSAKNPFNASLR